MGKNPLGPILSRIDVLTQEAVAHFWQTRKAQQTSQKQSGRRDQGSRGAVTGGAQMDGFLLLLRDLALEAGMDDSAVCVKRDLLLPGYFRATKQWDLLVVQEGRLLAAIEAKSQVGSFGNNCNNRIEEVIGVATDTWTAYREEAFGASPQPFLGYLFMLEDCEDSQTKGAKVREPHFEVFPEFKHAPYAKRYEILCKKLVLERQFTAAAFITSTREEGLCGQFSCPSEEFSMASFAKTFAAHIAGAAR